MRWTKLVIALFLLGSMARAATPPEAAEDLSRFFGSRRGTFVLLDARSGRTIRHDPALAAERVSPCSTFKIPNALIGLETGVLSGPDHPMAWDGIRRDIADWNQEQTLRTAVSRSVVWYFQRVASGVGEARMQRWLRRIPYGNEDISGGLTRFWLGSSLRISADEQVAFLRRLAGGDLPFSPRSMAIVRDLVRLQDTPRGVLHGKTGTCRRESGAALGWFVGWVESASGGLHVFALRIEGDGAAGTEARKIAERLLEAKGVLGDDAPGR